MTLDAAETLQVTEIAARVAAEVTRNAWRGTGGATMPLPVMRPGTVGGRANAGAEVSVRPDGDPVAIPAINAVGSVLEAGERVLIEWRTPNGVYVVHSLARASRGNWTPSIAGPGSSNSTATGVGHYTRHGSRVTISGRWTRGASSNLGTAAILAGLPFPVISDGDGLPAIFHGYILDVSIPRNYGCRWIVGEGNTSGELWTTFIFGTPSYEVITNLVDGSVPGAWATGDYITVHGTYDTDAA